MTGNFTVEQHVGAWAASITPGARVIVEGGHLTIRKHLIEPSNSVLHHQADNHYLVQITPHVASLPYERARGPLPLDERSGEPGLGAILCLPPGETLDTREHPEILQAFRLDFSPRPTELRSLTCALEAGARVEGRAGQVTAALFLGDLRLPTFVRKQLAVEELLPASYLEELRRFHFAERMQVFWETACRNRGKEKLLDSRSSDIVDSERREKAYRAYGCGVFEEPPGDGIYYLAADSLLQRTRFPLIALTKQKKKPTCGLIMAGKLAVIALQGYSHLLSVYDRADDAQIEEKNVEGMIIASCLARDFHLDSAFITVRGASAACDRPVASDFSNPGALPTFEQLVEQARAHAQAPLNVVENCASESCFPQTSRIGPWT